VVKLKDGSRLEERLQTPSDLHGWDTVAEKFHASTRGIINGPNSETIIDQIKALESVSSIPLLTRALRA